MLRSAAFCDRACPLRSVGARSGRTARLASVGSTPSACVGDAQPATIATVAITISALSGGLLPAERFHEVAERFIDAFAETLGVPDTGSFGQASTGEMDVWCLINEPPGTATGRVDEAVATAVRAACVASQATANGAVIVCERPTLKPANA